MLEGLMLGEWGDQKSRCQDLYHFHIQNKSTCAAGTAGHGFVEIPSSFET